MSNNPDRFDDIDYLRHPEFEDTSRAYIDEYKLSFYVKWSDKDEPEEIHNIIIPHFIKKYFEELCDTLEDEANGYWI